MRCKYIFNRKTGRKRPLGKPIVRWKGNVKEDLKYKYANYIVVALYRISGGPSLI
jgi:hypothetical protein